MPTNEEKVGEHIENEVSRKEGEFTATKAFSNAGMTTGSLCDKMSGPTESQVAYAYLQVEDRFVRARKVSQSWKMRVRSSGGRDVNSVFSMLDLVSCYHLYYWKRLCVVEVEGEVVPRKAGCKE